MEFNGHAEEVEQLQRCMSDLVSVLALPAVWSGQEPRKVVTTFHDALMAALNLDFLYTRARIEADGEPIEILRTAPLYAGTLDADKVQQTLNKWFGSEPQRWPTQMHSYLGGREISLVSMRLGIDGEIGIVIAGSGRADFPRQTERLILGVAANQVTVGLQQARLLIEQKRIASELDRRVAERTRELAEINEELKLQVGLLQHLPVSAWTLEPDGTPDFVNQVWLDFSGQTLDFVRSHPEAWMTAVHPDDREKASRIFGDAVRLGKSFAIETRSLRARDGTYRWHLQQAVVLRDAEGKVLKFVGTTTDIDDQKRAEEELRASESKLLRVIDTIPSLSWCNLPDGPNEFLSKGWHDYTGMSPEEAHGWGWAAAFHPDDLPPLMKRWQELLISGESGEIEARIRRHDGEFRWFLIRVAPFRDETGAILRWYGTSTDIHDRKLADEALRASETNLRQTVDSIPGLICTMNPAGEIEQLNQPLLEYFGKTPEELKGWRMTDAVHPDDLPEVVRAYTYSVTSGTPYDIEHRCRRTDGVYRWFQVRALAVRNADGLITGWYVLLTDIDDRKRAEEALLANERNLGLIISTIPVLAWSARADGNVDFFNQRWLDYTGLSLAEARDWGWAKVFHPEDAGIVSEYWQSRIAGGEPGEIEARLRRFDGGYRWFLFRANPLRDESGAIVKWYGTNTDIEERKRAEEDLRNTQSELARMTRVMTIGQLTASIAHEVSQPLSGMIMNASTTFRMLKNDPPNIDGARETIQRTIRDGNRASEVITRLRTLFSKRQIDIEPLDLNEAVREVIALLADELKKNNVTLTLEFSDRVPNIYGDRVQLQQVILNLIRNGADAMVTIDDRDKQLLITTKNDGTHVTVSVRDAGVGFSPKISERLFEPFFTTKQHGMGIGLSLCRSIIEAHHGRLWAVGNDGPGATFAFSIPQDAGAFPDRAA